MAVGFHVLENHTQRRIDVVCRVPVQGCAPASRLHGVDVFVDHAGIGVRAARAVAQHPVDEAGIFRGEADQPHGQLVLHQRYVDHCADIVADAAVAGIGELRLRPGIEFLRIRLVGNHAQRAGLRAGAVERALRPTQRFHPLDVDEPWVGIAAARRDRLLIEIKRRRGHGPEVEAGGRYATEHYGRAAGLALADRQARDEPRVVVHLLQAPDRDVLRVERGDRLRNILQAFRAARRSDDHLLQHAFGACRLGLSLRRLHPCGPRNRQDCRDRGGHLA